MSYVVIPAYCPDRTLVSLVEQMWETGCRMIVVDDGSGEEYQSIFDEISDVSVILRHPENSGKGAAIKSALEYIEQKHSHRDVVGIMDADGQHLPEDMLKLLEAAQDESHTLEIPIRGMQHNLATLSMDAVEVHADLSSYRKAGTYTVPVAVTLPDGFSCPSDLTVDVKLEKAD